MNRHSKNRRQFIGLTAAGVSAAWLGTSNSARAATNSNLSSQHVSVPSTTEPLNSTTTHRSSGTAPWFEISLAQWSLHRELGSKKLDNLDFAKITRTKFDIGAIEYVNSFFKDKAQDDAYLAGLNKRAEDHGVKQLLIMCDGEGALGDADAKKR